MIVCFELKVVEFQRTQNKSKIKINYNCFTLNLCYWFRDQIKNISIHIYPYIYIYIHIYTFIYIHI